MPRTCPAGVDLIKRCEGCKLTSYQDSVGVWTIGYGHTASAYRGQKITQDYADQLLASDLCRIEDGVAKLVRVPLNTYRFSALVSFSFNLGLGTLQKSTLLKRLNAGDYASVLSEIKKYTKAGGKTVPGLVKRRALEAALWDMSDNLA